MSGDIVLTLEQDAAADLVRLLQGRELTPELAQVLIHLVAALERGRTGIASAGVNATQDEHVFVLVETEDRPTVSLDIWNAHGRRLLSVRVNGMTIATLLVDIEELPPMDKNGAWIRFCPYCGEEHDMLSSKSHECKTAESR